MITAQNLTYEIGGRALYNNANWHIKAGEKIGLIGPNGSGKTTLLKLLVGQYTPANRAVSMTKGLKIGYLNQDLLSYESDKNILHVAMEAFERQNQLHVAIQELLKKLEIDHSDEVLHKLCDKQQEFEALGGYNLEYRAHEILAGLGFSQEEQARPLSTFSGGWRMRVMLARILLQDPDLLLLDEPTNHLDLPSIKWLESYLQSFNGAIVIVSHDRYFLDRIVNKTVEVKGGKLNSYAGNYSFYLEEKALREEIQRGQYKNQQAKIKQEERLIERFRAKASKAKMVQSRIKALEKMELIEEVSGALPSINFSFKFSRSSGKHVVKLEGISKSYPGVSLLEGAHAIIEKGDKIALIGANGRGKSTLLRIIANTDDNYKGRIEMGHHVTTTFFAQHQLESLNLENEILTELQATAQDHNETELRSLLGCFLFTGDDVFKKIKVLSGGEKSRVALAKSLTADANFLILDEPTNHLDIPSVNILVQALVQYRGTVVVVSHDRFFLSKVANKIWYIEDKKIKVYPGTYDEFEEWQTKHSTGSDSSSLPPQKNQKIKPSRSREHKDYELGRLHRSLQTIEQRILALKTSIEQIEKDLAKEETYSDQEKLSLTNQRHKDLSIELKKCTQEWDHTAEKILEKESHT